MPKYVPRLEGIMHDPKGSALCLLTLGHISAYNMDNTKLLLLLLWILRMRMCIGKWLKVQCHSLWVQDFPFQCIIFIGKKNRREVYCSVLLVFSRCIDHFISYSHIVYTGYRLGHVICLLIYFRLAAMLLNILKCISMFILLLEGKCIMPSNLGTYFGI
jgi:hypothetical protein